jgi:HD-GYP domain-containing protein (c-di-GMP phosphodiesterase class II)
MTAERPYQKKRTNKEAKAELKKCSCTQFDPLIVRIFLESVLKMRTQTTPMNCLDRVCDGV